VARWDAHKAPLLPPLDTQGVANSSVLLPLLVCALRVPSSEGQAGSAQLSNNALPMCVLDYLHLLWAQTRQMPCRFEC
jgi:hypothetical protein